MIYNGKYIEYDEKSSVRIQSKINTDDNLKSDLKSDINPQEILNGNISNFEFNNSSYGLFNENNKNDTLQDRTNRYEIYREMDYMEFIHRGLEIISDDSTQNNTDSNTIKIISDNEDIKEKLDDLFINRLDMNTSLWNIVYETVKFGDNFYEIVPDSYKNPKKIVYLKYLKPEKVTKVLKNGKVLYYEYQADAKYDLERINDKKVDDFLRKNKDGKHSLVFRLQPWQIVHFKIEDKEFEPYGGSLLKSGVKTFRRLSLLEDVMLVYTISRAPERRVFYIDVGNMNVTDSKRFLQKIKNQYRTENFIDENGNINKKSNVLSITSDIFVPQREGGGGTKIETLQAGQALQQSVEFLNYLKDKILRTMNIPSSYLGDNSDRSRGGLASQDIKFARFIERIQDQILKGLNKIASLELFFAGEKKENLYDFILELTPPSNIKEITDIDLINQRMALVAAVQQLNLFSNEWIMKNILKMSSKEISDIMLQKNISGQNNQEAGLGGMPVGNELGGEMGGENPAEAPPVGGEIPAETPPVGGETQPPEQLAASTLINILGKEFIVENTDDFFSLIKEIKDDKKRTNIPLFNLISENVTAPVKKKNKRKTESVRKLFIEGEFSGLKWENGYGKAIKLYDKHNKNDKIIIENEIFNYNKI